MTKPQIGGSEYNAELARIRRAANTFKESLQRILEGTGPQAAAQLIAQMALQIGTIFDAVGNLERIGRDTRNERNKPEQN